MNGTLKKNGKEGGYERALTLAHTHNLKTFKQSHPLNELDSFMLLSL